MEKMKHRIKKAVLLLLALCCVAWCAAGCVEKAGPSVNTEAGTLQTDSGEATTLQDDGKTKLVWNGKAVYSLVYPDNCAPAVRVAMEAFLAAVNDATGVRLEQKTDKIKRGAVYDSSAREILFGRTGYGETAEALRELADDQFTIREVGNKIVIVSPQDANLEAAVDCFREHLLAPNLTDDVNGKTLYFEEFTSVHTEKNSMVIINGTPLSEFSIVWETERAGYRSVADRLKNMIEEKYGVSLPVYADNDAAHAEEPDEILIGKTNRAVSAALWSELRPKLMNYEAVVQGGKLQIVSGGPWSARQCVDYLRFNLGETLAEGSWFATDLAPDATERAVGTDLRLMTYNIDAEVWRASGAPTVAENAEIFAAILYRYRPDALGVQETDWAWQETMPIYLDLLKNEYGLEYAWELRKIEGKINMTSLLYRSDRFTLLDSGYRVFNFWPASKDHHLRNVSWIRLQSRENPDFRFILANTHWAFEDAERITASAEEEIAEVKQLTATYGDRVFCTGDFNRHTDSVEYQRFLSETGAADCHTLAKAAGVLLCDTGGCGAIGASRRLGTDYIDHIAGTGDYTVLQFESIVGNQIHWLSDHAPHYSDIKFN